MAKDTLAINGVPLNPTGLNDNQPLSADPEWYQTRGMHSISELCLQRMSGKALINKFDAPILAIHGELREQIIIETATTLYSFAHLDDAIPV